ncbi:MAG: AzlD domain-containing protein [Spirochaetaceae bacterium]
MRIFLAILAMGIATQLTRVFPFLLFSKREAPRWLLTGAKLIPGAVMLTLVLTSLPLSVAAQNFKLQWLGAASVVTLHLLFKHPLVSIFGGTAVYMLLLQLTL